MCLDPQEFLQGSSMQIRQLVGVSKIAHLERGCHVEEVQQICLAHYTAHLSLVALQKYLGNLHAWTNQTETVNWSYGDCVRDCHVGSAPGCGGVKNAWDVAYATSVTCCSTISWKADCGP